MLNQRIATGRQAAKGAGHPFSRKELEIAKRAHTAALMAKTSPRTQITNGVIVKGKLYLGTTSNGFIGNILALLKVIGIEADFFTPWMKNPSEPTEHLGSQKHKDN